MTSTSPDIAIRAATAADLDGVGRVQLASWRTMWVGIAPPGYLDQFSDAERAAGWHDLLAEQPDQFVYVAVTPAGEVVGYACCDPDSNSDPAYPAELTTMHVLLAYRNQGIGRRLVGAVVAHLQAQGASALMLWTLAANGGARRFYERLGGQPLGSHIIPLNEEETVTVAEVSYGWTDLDALAAQQDELNILAQCLESSRLVDQLEVLLYSIRVKNTKAFTEPNLDKWPIGTTYEHFSLHDDPWPVTIELFEIYTPSLPENCELLLRNHLSESVNQGSLLSWYMFDCTFGSIADLFIPWLSEGTYGIAGPNHQPVLAISKSSRQKPEWHQLLEEAATHLYAKYPSLKEV